MVLEREGFDFRNAELCDDQKHAIFQYIFIFTHSLCFRPYWALLQARFSL